MVKVRLLRDCYDGKKGEILTLDQLTAFSWVQGEIAEFVEPVTKAPDLAAREERAKPAPKNRVKKAPANRAKAKKEEE